MPLCEVFIESTDGSRRLSWKEKRKRGDKPAGRVKLWDPFASARYQPPPFLWLIPIGQERWEVNDRRDRISLLWRWSWVSSSVSPPLSPDFRSEDPTSNASINRAQRALSVDTYHFRWTKVFRIDRHTNNTGALLFAHFFNTFALPSIDEHRLKGELCFLCIKALHDLLTNFLKGRFDEFSHTVCFT